MFENNKRGVALAQVDLVGVVFQRISCCAIKSCLLPCSLSTRGHEVTRYEIRYLFKKKLLVICCSLFL